MAYGKVVVNVIRRKKITFEVLLGASDLILLYYWGGLRSAAPTGGGPCSAVLRHLRVANALVRV